MRTRTALFAVLAAATLFTGAAAFAVATQTDLSGVAIFGARKGMTPEEVISEFSQKDKVRWAFNYPMKDLGIRSVPDILADTKKGPFMPPGWGSWNNTEAQLSLVQTGEDVKFFGIPIGCIGWDFRWDCGSKSYRLTSVHVDLKKGIDGNQACRNIRKKIEEKLGDGPEGWTDGDAALFINWAQSQTFMTWDKYGGVLAKKFEDEVVTPEKQRSASATSEEGFTAAKPVRATPTPTPEPAPAGPATSAMAPSGTQYFTQDGLTSAPRLAGGAPQPAPATAPQSGMAIPDDDGGVAPTQKPAPTRGGQEPPRGPNALATIATLGEYTGKLSANGQTGPVAIAITIANIKKRTIYCLVQIDKDTTNGFMGTGPATEGEPFTIERKENDTLITFKLTATRTELKGTWRITTQGKPPINGTCTLTKTLE